MLIETNKWYSYRSESLRGKDDELESILHKDIRDQLRVDMFSYGQFAGNILFLMNNRTYSTNR